MTAAIVNRFADHDDYRRQYKAASQRGDLALREELKQAWAAQKAQAQELADAAKAQMLVTPDLQKAVSKLELIKRYKALQATAKELCVDMLWEEIKYDKVALEECRAHEARGLEARLLPADGAENAQTDSAIEVMMCEATMEFYDAAISFAEDWNARLINEE